MKENLRIAVVYTGMPTVLVGSVETEVRQALKGRAVTFLSLSDPSIIDDAVKNGGPSPAAVKRLYALYHMAVAGQADIVYNVCSSVGVQADAAKPLFEQMNVPFVRIDEHMARCAAKEHQRIGVLATLSTTLLPTKGLLERVIREENSQARVVEALVDGAFGVTPERMTQMVLDKAVSLKDEVDCFLLAQGSMATSRAAIEAATGRPVYDSPRYGAMAIRQAAQAL